MKLWSVPYELIRDRVSLTWREILWGYERQLVGWSSLVALALDKAAAGSNDPKEIELAGLQKDESWRAGDLLRILAKAEAPNPENLILRKWLFLVLLRLFENRSQFADPLGEVESVYADFEYPEEMTSFVRFMPPTDGYDPLQFSRTENERRLLGLWQKYLVAAGCEFGKQPPGRELS